MTYDRIIAFAAAQAPGLETHPGLAVWRSELSDDIADLHARYGHIPDTRPDELPVPERFARMYALYYRARYEQATGDYDAANAYMTDFIAAYNEYHTCLARQYQTPGTRYTSTL